MTTTTTQPPGPANIAGSYNLTLTASSVCTQLPASLREKRYQATITQSGQNAAVNLTGGNFIDATVRPTISGNSVSFVFQIQEMISIFELHLISAQGTGAVTQTTISGDLNGTFQFVGATSQSCNAVNHRFTFTRR